MAAMNDKQPEWQQPDHVHAYLAKMHEIPHRIEGEATLLSELPTSVSRILDLGCGDGHLLHLVLEHCPNATGVGIDFSPPMLAAARNRFRTDTRATLVNHDLNDELPQLGQFDAVVSSFAIHHCPDERKQTLCAEIYDRLQPGGIFCNLEHVSSPSEAAHDRFVTAMKMTRTDEDPSNILLDVETQLHWLRQVGLEDVDCYWKWRELALLAGRRPKSDAKAEYVIEEDPSQAEIRCIDRQLEDYNSTTVGRDDWETVHLVVRDNHRIVGGLKAITGWDWLYVQILWVDESQRRNGLGTRLLHRAEAIAQERNCRGACLSSFSFQAPEFYRRHGYKVFGQINEYPTDETMYFLSKSF